MKFGTLDAARMTTLNRDHFIIPSTNNSSSEILEIKEVGSIDEVRNFRTDGGGVPYMMDRPYQAVVRFEPMSYSYSQHTTTTTISRENSIKLRKENGSENTTFNSIARKLRNCTKKTPKVVKSDARNGRQKNHPQQVVEVVCVNPPFLRETDEEAIDLPHVLAEGDDYEARNFYQIDSSSS